ncbi:hypothetical protein SISSUDRAFT_1066966 [Sistotremastrum suecicum HHB10207 ss-3]|uniref:Uncharacterized protein n=1 Tax=Sistotremastrum suecicum HHB10207 ss-3 TaxID=1314776 RepID=A0A165XPB2_9AGAM|nr:hypothetical protein SISSUDRAFT_1066966 [Sistotremastrum suecicum HHB10207 ss-3]
MSGTQGPLQTSNTVNKGTSKRGRTAGALSDEAKKQAKKVKEELDDRERARIEAVFDMIDEQVDKLVAEFNKPESHFLTQLHMGGDVLKSRRLPTVYNGYVHASMAESNLNLTAAEKLRLEILMDKVPTTDDDGNILLQPWRHVDDQTAAELKECVREYREKLEKGPIVRPHAVTVATAMSMEKIEKALTDLNARTGVEWILWAVKGRAEDHTKPMARMTEKGEEFLINVLNRDATRTSIDFERFVLGGVNNVIRNAAAKYSEVRKQLRETLTAKLRIACGTNSSIQMEYTKFDKNITAVYGVVMEGWPLDKGLVNPSDLTLAEIKRVADAVKSGDCYFRKLSTEELKEKLGETEGSGKRKRKAGAADVQVVRASTTASITSDIPLPTANPSTDAPIDTAGESHVVNEETRSVVPRLDAASDVHTPNAIPHPLSLATVAPVAQALPDPACQTGFEIAGLSNALFIPPALSTVNTAPDLALNDFNGLFDESLLENIDFSQFNVDGAALASWGTIQHDLSF